LKTLIHPTAVIHSGAQLHPTVQVGPYAVVGDQVKVGSETLALMLCWRDQQKLVPEINFSPRRNWLGPPRLKYNGASWVKIGDGNRIREYVTINRATGADE